jgi:hypothetical protein
MDAEIGKEVVMSSATVNFVATLIVIGVALVFGGCQVLALYRRKKERKK